MTNEQISAVQNYLRARFDKESVTLKKRNMGSSSIDDSVEVYMDDEILGVLYMDDEDKDDISFDLNISILADDLNG